MATSKKSQTQTPVAKRMRRKSNPVDRGEIRDLEVYKCADGYNPLVSIGGEKEELLGKMPYSDNFLKDAARRWGGGRYLYFIPVYGDSTWGSGDALYCPEVIEPEIIPDYDPEIGLEMLDEDDLDDADLRNPEVVRSKIEIARLKAELKASSQNGVRSSIGELLEGIKIIEELRGQSPPQKSFAEQLREAKEVNELINPKSEQSQPQSPQSHRSEDEIFVSAIASKPEIVEKLASGVFRKFLGDGAAADSDPWAEIVRETIQSGQAAAIVQAAFAGLSGLLSPLMSRGETPQSAPPQSPQQPAQIDTPQTPQAPDTAAALQQNANDDLADFYQTVSPYLEQVIADMRTNTNIERAISIIDGYCAMHQRHAEKLLGYLGTPADALFANITSIPGCEDLKSLPHGQTWLSQLQDELFSEESDKGSETDQAGDDQKGGQ
jgi:predicted RNA-binding protein Jag